MQTMIFSNFLLQRDNFFSNKNKRKAAAQIISPYTAYWTIGLRPEKDLPNTPTIRSRQTLSGSRSSQKKPKAILREKRPGMINSANIISELPPALLHLYRLKHRAGCCCGSVRAANRPVCFVLNGYRNYSAPGSTVFLCRRSGSKQADPVCLF